MISAVIKRTVLALVALALLYALGIGPVAACTKTGLVSFATFKQVYSPLVWLYDHGVLKQPMEAYCKLWGFP
jgi:hypothetical protein